MSPSLARTLGLWGLVPFVAAWLALAVPAESGLWLLAAAFLLALVNDHAVFRAGLIPAWFLGLRRGLTTIVVSALLLAAALA